MRESGAEKARGGRKVRREMSKTKKQSIFSISKRETNKFPVFAVSRLLGFYRVNNYPPPYTVLLF